MVSSAPPTAGDDHDRAVRGAAWHRRRRGTRGSGCSAAAEQQGAAEIPEGRTGVRRPRPQARPRAHEPARPGGTDGGDPGGRCRAPGSGGIGRARPWRRHRAASRSAREADGQIEDGGVGGPRAAALLRAVGAERRLARGARSEEGRDRAPRRGLAATPQVGHTALVAQAASRDPGQGTAAEGGWEERGRSIDRWAPQAKARGASPCTCWSPRGWEERRRAGSAVARGIAKPASGRRESERTSDLTQSKHQRHRERARTRARSTPPQPTALSRDPSGRGPIGGRSMTMRNTLVAAALGFACVASFGRADASQGDAGEQAPSNAPCRLGNGAGRIEHVIYIQFDNTHLLRDRREVPSDLEQMPHLLNFIRENGTLLANDHTVLISHTAGGILSTLTGVYPD